MAKNQPPRRSAWADSEVPPSPLEQQTPEGGGGVFGASPGSWGGSSLDNLPDTWEATAPGNVPVPPQSITEGEEILSPDEPLSLHAASQSQSPFAPAPQAAAPVLKMSAMLRGIAAPQVLEETPAKERKPRNREWEKQHNREWIQFRAIPVETHETILWLADYYKVSSGQIARMLLEHGLECYREGVLSFTPEVSGGKWTLFPKNQNTVKRTKNTGRRTPMHLGRKKAGEKRKKKTGLIRVAYRDIPEAIQNNLRRIAGERDVPLTEVGRMLLQFSLEDVERGALVLTSSAGRM